MLIGVTRPVWMVVESQMLRSNGTVYGPPATASHTPVKPFHRWYVRATGFHQMSPSSPPDIALALGGCCGGLTPMNVSNSVAPGVRENGMLSCALPLATKNSTLELFVLCVTTPAVLIVSNCNTAVSRKMSPAV